MVLKQCLLLKYDRNESGPFNGELGFVVHGQWNTKYF